MSETLKFRILIYLHLNIGKSVFSLFLLGYTTIIPRCRVSLEDSASPGFLVAYGGEGKGDSVRLQPYVYFRLGIPGDVEPVGLVGHAPDPDGLPVLERPVRELVVRNGIAVVYYGPYGPCLAVGLAFPHYLLVFAQLEFHVFPFACLYIISFVHDGFRPEW